MERSITIEELDFSVRTFNCLSRAGVRTVQDLIEMTWEDLCRIRNLRTKGATEVALHLERFGLELKVSKE